MKRRVYSGPGAEYWKCPHGVRGLVGDTGENSVFVTAVITAMCNIFVSICVTICVLQLHNKYDSQKTGNFGRC